MAPTVAIGTDTRAGSGKIARTGAGRPQAAR